MEMKKFRRLSVFLLFLLYISFSLFSSVRTVTANVVLLSNDINLSFDDIEANFGPYLNSSGEFGSLYVAEPLDGCSPLKNKINENDEGSSLPPFVLIIRGGCTFEDKVRTAQTGGFKAAIVYNDMDNDALVAMAGSSIGIKIHAVFVSNRAGEMLKKYAAIPSTEILLSSNFENSAWSIIAISFISLLAMSAVLATCFLIRKHRMRRERPRARNVREFHGMSSRLVKALPSLIFTSVLEDNCTSVTCAICIEDYCVGEKLRVLPCRHKFHAACVDAWLTTWRTFCPVCKRDARTSSGNPPPSEHTPLLLSGQASPSHSVISSSLRSSSAIQIARGSSRSLSVSHGHSVSSIHCNSHSLRSYRNSPMPISSSRSSTDLRNVSSQISLNSHFFSSDSQYVSPCLPTSSDASSSYVGSFDRHPFLFRHNESATNISPFASAPSLPGC